MAKMTQCEDCKKEYHSAESCTFAYVSIEGEVYSRKRGYDIGENFEKDLAEPIEEKRCDDCGVVIGKFHHSGCTLEECPVCGEELATCACDDVKTLKNNE